MSNCMADASGSTVDLARAARSPSVCQMAEPLILIVEDHDKNLKLVRDVLQVKGYRTLEAATAERALALTYVEVPDLVLMDIQLPGMNGIDAIARLRADARTEHVPVVALTAFAMSDDRERILAAGFDGYLAKPIDIVDLLQQVAYLVAR